MDIHCIVTFLDRADLAIVSYRKKSKGRVKFLSRQGLAKTDQIVRTSAMRSFRRGRTKLAYFAHAMSMDNIQQIADVV